MGQARAGHKEAVSLFLSIFVVIGSVKVSSHVDQDMSIQMLNFDNDESCFSQP